MQALVGLLGRPFVQLDAVPQSPSTGAFHDVSQTFPTFGPTPGRAEAPVALNAALNATSASVTSVAAVSRRPTARRLPSRLPEVIRLRSPQRDCQRVRYAPPGGSP